MLKTLAIALAVSSFGLVGASSAQAGCGCADGATATVAATVPAPAAAVTAQAPANRTYRSYSYQPGSPSSSVMPSYRSTNPAFRRADAKIFGR